MSSQFQAQASAFATRGAETGATPWLSDFRARGTKRFEQLPLPTLKTEDWKYTSLRGLFEADLLHEAPASSATEELLPDVPNRLVLVNGSYSSKGSRLRSLEDVECTSFEQADDEQRVLIDGLLGHIADDAQHPFIALNEAMTTDGLLVHVPTGVRTCEPVHLVHVDCGTGVSRFARVLVVLSPGSSLTLIEHHVGAEPPRSSTDSFTNTVTEVQVGDAAALVHCRVQCELARGYHLGGTYADLERASSYALHQFTLADRVTRNDVRVRMRAPEGSCTVNGVYLCRDRQHVDTHTSIEHCAPHCTSQEDFHGIVMDRSRAVFNGRILIHPGAQRSEARLNNRNLLLSSEAEVDTKPELEIYADDVKCAHGATVGELDAEAKFYLRSRGIDRDAAQALLVRAFAKSRIDQIPTSWLREHIEQRLLSRLETGRER